MDKVRICLVGAGRAGEVHGDAYYFSVRGAVVTAVFDTDAVKAKNLAEKYHINEKSVFKKFEDALSYAGFDAVVITTPTFSHCQYTKMAASQKIHVFCKKPMAITEKYTTVTCTREKQIVSPQVLSWKKRFHDAYIAEDRHFVDCIVNGKKPGVTSDDGKKAVAAVVAANKSIFKGTPVEL